MAIAHMVIAGRYRLLEPVGTGGMGRVWLARDEMLDRDVAVKEFVPPGWMTEDEQARLRDRTLREARSAGRLNHPHVVRIYDVVHAEDLPWIVMEYVPSRSLHQVIQEDGPYSPVAAARIGLAVLDALSAAHRAGVLHRDVKPHNVLIGTDGRVVLTDFGLATFVDDGTVTGPGLAFGSPQYVSPERARDRASTVESDMWSLGATLYAAVEGRSPYQRESTMATLMALASQPPDPPRRAGLLGPVLLGLLRHDPAARLTASEVERRLRMVVGASGAPSPRKPRGVVPAQRVSPESMPPPSPPPRRPRPALMAAGLTLVAALGIGAIVAGYLVQRTGGQPHSSPSSPAFVVAGFSPASCSDAPGSSAAMPQASAARGVNGWDLLTGWSYFSDGTGFHLAVPDGWVFRKIGSLYCFSEPGGRRMLSLDAGRNPTADPVTACRTEANRLVLSGALPDYSEISIEAKPLLNKAADWEYSFRAGDGSRLHVRTRWFASNGKGYALSWATQEIDWTGDLAKVNMVISTFYADRP